MNKVESIKKLREVTGLGLAECKEALDKTSTYDEAVQYLKANAKPSSKPVGAGGVFTYRHHNGLMGAILELQCGTDFVARSASFDALGSLLVRQVAAMNPQSVEELLEQEALNDGRKVGEVISSASARFNEPLVVARFTRYVLGVQTENSVDGYKK